MKRIYLLFGALFLLCQATHAQVQVVTTGDNLINTASPYAADVVIGSDVGTRHDASIMWWSNVSADRISLTNDEFYLSRWNTANANVGLGAVTGHSSFFLGNLLIGETTQTNTSYMLDVAGPARMNSVVVNTTGADFVFKPFYKLASLPELKEYIDLNHHLPGIAPAIEIDLGENQVKLLQKVEELTLYTIASDKQISEEQALITQQKETLAQQQSLLLQMQDQLKQQQKEIDELKNKHN